MNKLICVNEEIESVSLYTLRPLLLHGYVLPFVLLYSVWLYVWGAVLGFSDFVEAGCIGIVIIGLLQVVCSLLCHWFVSVRCVLTCSRVRLIFVYCLNLLTRISRFVINFVMAVECGDSFTSVISAALQLRIAYRYEEKQNVGPECCLRNER